MRSKWKRISLRLDKKSVHRRERFLAKRKNIILRKKKIKKRASNFQALACNRKIRNLAVMPKEY